MTRSTSSFRLQLMFTTGLLLSAANTSAQQNLNVQSLDAFLEGFDDECRYSSELSAFTYNLIGTANDVSIYPLTPDAALSQLSPSIRESFGSIKIIEETGGYLVISAELNGYWDGVEVERLEFVKGIENRINGVSVIFSPPSDRAISVFESRIERSAKRMKNDPENDIEGSTGFDTNGESVRIWCDWST